MYSRITLVFLWLALASCGGSNGGGNQFNEAPTPVDNQPPQLSDIDDQTIDANSSTDALAITVSDDRTTADELTLSATADNPDLLSDSAFSFSGAGSMRTLTVTPVEDATGMTTITVTVSDGDGATSASRFTLNVEQTTVSFSGFVRDLFMADANSEPVAVEGFEFDQDAVDDDFADLLQ